MRAELNLLEAKKAVTTAERARREAARQPLLGNSLPLSVRLYHHRTPIVVAVDGDGYAVSVMRESDEIDVQKVDVA